MSLRKLITSFLLLLPFTVVASEMPCAAVDKQLFQYKSKEKLKNLSNFRECLKSYRVCVDDGGGRTLKANLIKELPASANFDVAEVGAIQGISEEESLCLVGEFSGGSSAAWSFSGYRIKDGKITEIEKMREGRLNHDAVPSKSLVNIIYDVYKQAISPPKSVNPRFIGSITSSERSPCLRVPKELTKDYLGISSFINMGSYPGAGKELEEMLAKCLAKNQVCIGGWHEKREAGTYKLLESSNKIWAAATLDQTPDGSYGPENDMLVAVIQLPESNSNKHPACIAAKNLFVNAAPWLIQGWEIQENKTEIIHKPGSGYEDKVMLWQGSPKEVVDNMLMNYQHWIEKKAR